jgi:flagellar basal-body rod modification protein FlgD
MYYFLIKTKYILATLSMKISIQIKGRKRKMSTSAVSSSTSSTTSTTSTTDTTSLSYESFLSLLATELQYQDPTDPVSATEYVSQMAQISSLDALSNISTSINNATAYSMIGQTATYSTTDTSGDTVSGTGVVQSVTISGSSTYVNVGGTTVDLDSITSVASST